ncbi:universal stress protein [Streptomyces parvus]
MGSRGRGELSALLLGSVSLLVAARAACPVVVIRGDEAALNA